MSKLTFELINESQGRLYYAFLYVLLKEREPSQNISHGVMPSFIEHVKFVESNPYKVWYAILLDAFPIGSIYLTKKNEVGIFIKKEMQGMGWGRRALKMLISKHGKLRYLANINPKNKRSIKFFEKHGFKLIQYTYERK